MTEPIEESICAGPDCGILFTKSVHNQRFHNQQCKRDAENAVRRRELAADVVAALAPSYGISTDDSLEFLRKEVQRLARENEKLKHQRVEQVAALYKGIKDGLSGFRMAPIKSPAKDRRSKTEEVCVSVISDLQLSKVTPTYDTGVCEDRMDVLADKTHELTEIQRSNHPVRETHIWLLGDIIEGQGIFPGQQFLVDAGFYRQVTIDGPRIVGDFIRRQLELFTKVKVVCVIGNHGRMGGMARTEFDPESNGDRMLYRILAIMFADEPRVEFVIPDGKGERNWYAVDSIGNYSSLLCHGDQFSTFGSMYAIGRKVLGWKAGAIEEPWDDIFIGHFHQSTKLTFGQTVMRVNGSTESTNTYAQEKLASLGVPSQHLMYVNPERGIVTTEQDIFLGDC